MSGYTIADIDISQLTTAASSGVTATSGTIAAAVAGKRIVVLQCAAVKGAAAFIQITLGSKIIADSGWNTGGGVAPSGIVQTIGPCVSADNEALLWAINTPSTGAAYSVTYAYVPTAL